MDQETLETLRKLLKEELEPIKNDIKELKVGQEKLEKGQKTIKKDLEAVIQQTSDLTEFRYTATTNLKEIKRDVGDIKRSINHLEIATANNWLDIAKMKSVK